MLGTGERKRLWLLVFCSALTSLADIASLALLLFVVHVYTQPGHVSGTLPVWMYDNGSLVPVLACLFFFILRNLAAYFVYRAQAMFVHHVAVRISRQQLMQYLDGSYEDYVSVDTSVRIHRINHEPVEFAQYVLSGIQQIGAELLLTTIAVTAILVYNARLFLLLVVFLVPPVLLVAYFTRKKLRHVRRQVKSDAERTTQYLQEALGGYVEANVYGRKDFFARRHSHYQRQLNGHLAALQITQWAPSRIVEVFAVTGLFILILVNRYAGAAADIVSIGAFMAAAYKIIPGIVRIANLGAQVRTYEHTIYDLQPAPLADNVTTATEPVSSIVFHNLFFAHTDADVLRDFNLAIHTGDFLDIVAPSGKGKTTLLNLLLGFLSPDEGSISINGKAADMATLKNYRSRIAYVKQQTFLVHDTIRRNITLEEETADEQRLMDALHQAGLDELVASFTEGIDKIITDSGRNISGGQRKRIALARALYKNADVILLDEPFSELDEAAERSLLAHFRELAKNGKVVVLITHNRISEQYCNKTVFLHG